MLKRLAHVPPGHLFLSNWFLSFFLFLSPLFLIANLTVAASYLVLHRSHSLVHSPSPPVSLCTSLYSRTPFGSFQHPSFHSPTFNCPVHCSCTALSRSLSYTLGESCNHQTSVNSTITGPLHPLLHCHLPVIE
jgi:hypothetical protein